jgi:HAD superfamily hydrolase (TIGR01509 family)
MTIEAILFDVDGTLADTEEAHRVAFNRAFADHGLPWSWDPPLYRELLDVAGGKERILHYIDRYLPHFAPPARADFVRELHARKTAHYAAAVREGGVPLRPGIARLLRDAHRAGLRLAIATTTAPGNVTALLGATLGQDWASLFEVIGAGDVVPKKKPAPDVYLWVLNALALRAEACIALEDSSNGLRAARGAGLRTYITVNAYTRGQDFEGAEAVFEDLEDLERFYEVTRLRGDFCSRR